MVSAGALADAAVSIAMAHPEVLSCTILEKGDCEVGILLLQLCTDLDETYAIRLFVFFLLFTTALRVITGLAWNEQAFILLPLFSMLNPGLT